MNPKKQALIHRKEALEGWTLNMPLSEKQAAELEAINKELAETKVWYWTLPNDANHKNSYAEVDGIEFFKFPYSPYMSNHLGKYSAIIGVSMFFNQKDKTTEDKWGCSIHEAIGNGNTKVIDKFYFVDKDSVFIEAARKLREYENSQTKID